MRFIKGGKVEVLRNTEGLSVEWRCAHIVSGNGHIYHVQYDHSDLTSEDSVERVPSKAIRPCPPLTEGVWSWATNDPVEVYDAGSWKAATVLKFVGRGFYLVRLWVSCMELRVHRVTMRVRQSWQDGQWVVQRMGPGSYGVGKSGWSLISNSHKVMPEVQQAKNVCSPGLDASGLEEPHLASYSTLKRVSPNNSCPIEAHPRKLRAVVNNGECERFKALSTAPLLEKVDAIAYPQNGMGQKCMLTSFTTKQYHETGKENAYNVTAHFLEKIEEPDYSYSHLSSVGSCSMFSNTMAGLSCDENALCSDADSIDVGDVDRRCTITPKEVVTEINHRLELHAYHSTLEAMYASGPLSWEQEELLTNLRISLNISNDEHLMAIKNLVSASQHF